MPNPDDSETEDPSCENERGEGTSGKHHSDAGTAAAAVRYLREGHVFTPSGILLIPIVLYKKLISPLLPPCCRFTPSCSAYAVEAIMVHGAWYGGYLTVRRLLRCQPFGGSGYDPVPPKREKKHAETKKEKTK